MTTGTTQKQRAVDLIAVLQAMRPVTAYLHIKYAYFLAAMLELDVVAGAVSLRREDNGGLWVERFEEELCALCEAGFARIVWNGNVRDVVLVDTVTEDVSNITHRRFWNWVRGTCEAEVFLLGRYAYHAHCCVRERRHCTCTLFPNSGFEQCWRELYEKYGARRSSLS